MERKSSPRILRNKRKRSHSQDYCQEEKFNNIRKRLNQHNQYSKNPYEQIPEIPNIKLSVQDMNSDPIQLFVKLEKHYRDFGAVKLTASESWNCPFAFKFIDRGITTRVQCLQKLKEGKGFEQNIEAYSIKGYETFAKEFQKKYTYKSDVPGKSEESRKQFEYWKLVTDDKYCTSQINVQYASDLSTIRYGSGFPTRAMKTQKNSGFQYENNLFNLNNIFKSPSSVLGMSQKRKQKISGITHPWLYMGMLFSTFCWHVEDLWVNSLNYNHKGSIKTWYVIPGDYKQKFDEYIKKTYCSNPHKKNLLDRITFMVDPIEIIKNGIPVYKAYQRPKDYICTFFKAYHGGFSQGYNIGQAVNFLSPLSIDQMALAKEHKLKNDLKSLVVVPIEWVIYQNYQRIKQIPKYTQVIEKHYKKILKDEENAIKKAIETYNVEEVEIFEDKTKYDKYYCHTCRDYLYLCVFKSSQDNKSYCISHLFEKVYPETPIYIFLRELNADRKRIKAILKI